MQAFTKTLKIRNQLIDLSIPKIMGILNITPDSFFDGGKYAQDDAILQQTEKMLREGASFIDIGGYSSRPGADDISEEEEKRRVMPVITLLQNHFPEVHISIDTFRANIAREAVERGAVIINDISGGEADEKMLPTVADLAVPYVLMHRRGNAQTMAQLTDYTHLIQDICLYFTKKVHELQALGHYEVMLDVGFGFSKDIKQNYHLLRHLSVFHSFGLPLLVGISRKSMIYKALGITAAEALNGTGILHTLALQAGASILRVHDVKEAKEAIQLIQIWQEADKI